MVPAYRARRKPSLLRSLWRAAWRLLTVLLVLALAAIAALRYVNPPTTAFILADRIEGWQAGERLQVHQQWVPYACVGEAGRLAVIAAEDQKFASHSGFDVDQIANAVAEARGGGGLRGASTITQQTVKNLFLWSGVSWLRKGLEAALTVPVELLWPKRRILEVYLNVAEFGRGVYGVEAAARRYFGKPAARLDPAEAALLAAVLPNPRVLRVDRPSPYVRDRQRWIQRYMGSVRHLPGMAELRAPPSGRCAAVAG